MKRKNVKAFTLIELVIVVVILGILAAIAGGKYVDIQRQGIISKRDAVVGAVKSGIAIYTSKQIAEESSAEYPYPTALDSASDGTYASADTPLFGNVLEQPVTDGRWQKLGVIAEDYIFYYRFHFTPPLGSGDEVSNYHYDSHTGVFEEGAYVS